VPFFVACFLYYSPGREYLRFVALGIFILAAVSDAADGYIARKSKLQSKAGLILDPLGDKLLLMSAFICLTFIDRLDIRFPLWVTLIVISRDIIIILGAIVIYVVKQNIEVFPTRWGKLTTIFQMAAVIVVMLQWNLSFVFWWLAVVLSVVSGIDYIRRGYRALYALDNHRSTH
jgi:CDP-diacylglycerol--glycerol-3-phosphate 3-phosphatidyltransferase